MNLPITTRVAKARGCGSSPAKQLKRSTKVRAKSERTAAKGRKAVDEGRDKKATRLLKRAARQENRSINIEEREDDYDLKRRGFNNMSRDGIA